jgi:opacity protein-like surface antigen
MRRLSVIAFALALGLGAGTAHGQGYLSVSRGYTYGGVAGECPSVWNDCPNRPTGWGLGFGKVGKVFGFEQEYAWTSDFFPNTGGDLEGSKVTTLMTNILAGVPLGPVRAFGVFGVGLTKTKLEYAATGVPDFSDTSWGWDYGAGVIVLLPAHLGLRIDYRRFSTSSEVPYVSPGGRNNISFEFSRATIGIVLH